MTYLDTNVALWLRKGDKHGISKAALQAVESDDELLISPMVLFELELLHEIGRMKYPAADVAAELSASIGVRVCDYPFGLVVDFALRERWTRDPFDRIIVAHAHCRNAPLVTYDHQMRRHYKLAVW